MIMTKSSPIEPSEIGKHPNLIKNAQREMTELDVLVCGKCHAVYHHVESFKDHKAKPCKVDSTLKDCRETKAKVWAFLLWKASQISKLESNSVNSWKLYKEWMDQTEELRSTWIVAGETIQQFAKMGQGNLQELKKDDTPKTVTRVLNKPGGIQQQVAQKKEQTVVKTMAVPKLSPISSPLRQIQQRPGITIKRTEVPVSPPATKSPATDAQNLNRMLQNVQNKIFRGKHYDTEENVLKEYRVEKILAKRFNPRKRMHEYLVKWNANEPLEGNTWEPQTHLETCDPLLEIFETQLAKQKEARAKMQQQTSTTFDTIKQAPQSTPRVQSRPVAISRPPGRSFTSDEDSSLKRKHLDSDYDTTTEDESGFDASNKRIRADGGQVMIRTTVGRTVNGATGKSPSAAEIFLTNSKDGKNSGIVKKPGASVSPKIDGGAQIRIIGKGESTASGIVKITQGTKPIIRQTITRPAMGTKPVVGQTQMKQVTKQIVSNVKSTTQVGRTTVTRISNKPEAKSVTRIIARPGGMGRKPSSDDEDTGLTDMFPKEIKVPTPDPEQPLTLCPLTGKVLGQVEGDKQDDVKTEDGGVLLKQEETTTEGDTQISQVLANEDGTPLLVTGEDGTIYQVAGKNAEGQTILIAQGADGEQQCLFLAADEEQAILGTAQEADGGQIMQEAKIEPADGQAQQATDDQTSTTQQLTIQTDGEEGQITAEVIQAELPSPGGTRRVVLQLPDGSLVMTEVNDEQYQSLNLVN